MNGENKPIGPAPLPDNTPSVPPGGLSPPPPPSTPSVGSAPPGASGPPPPPPPQIDIRTMASDAESLERSGGLGTEPKTFSPADLAKAPVFTPEITSPADAVSTGTSAKKLGLAAGAVAILALAAAVGYFFVWPLISPGEEAEETVTTPSATLPTETQAPPAPSHQSYFAEPPAGSRQATLTSLTVAGLSESLKATAEESASAGSIKEVVLNTDSNLPVTSGQILELLLPGGDLGTYLESDVTVFAYYANGKAYPGYIFKLKSDADLAAAKTAAAANIEAAGNLSAFYPDNPGAPKGSWKSGSVSGVQTRYLAYSSLGASLNYGWLNNYLVISTSFDGFKKATELLP